MFVFSLPILFTHMELGTPLELILISLFLYAILLISTPAVSSAYISPNDPQTKPTLYTYLLYAWLGNLKLWQVFWPFFIILNLVLVTVDIIVKQGVFTVSSWDDIHFILITPIIFWTIAVWRNSINLKSRYWAAAARLMTLSVYFEYGLKLIIRKDYPRIFFACEELMLDYAGCF